MSNALAQPDSDADAALCAARVARGEPQSPWARWIARSPTPKRCECSASDSGRADLLARALISLARVQVFSGGLDAAVKSAELAVKTPRRSRKKPLARARLLNLAAAQMRLRKGDAAVRNATIAAARLFAALGDEMQRGRALWVARLRAGRPRPQGEKRTRRRRGACDCAPDRRPLGRGLGAQHPLAPEHRPRRSACAGCTRRWQAIARRDMFPDRRRSTTTWRSPIARLGCTGARTAWRHGPSRSGDACTTSTAWRTG